MLDPRIWIPERSSQEIVLLQLCDCSLKLGLTGTFEISRRGLTIAAKCLICIKLIVTLSETRANVNKVQYIPVPQGQDLILAGHFPPLWSDLHSISAALKHERNYLEPFFKDTLILPYCFAWISREGASFFFFFLVGFNIQMVWFVEPCFKTLSSFINGHCAV